MKFKDLTIGKKFLYSPFDAMYACVYEKKSFRSAYTLDPKTLEPIMCGGSMDSRGTFGRFHYGDIVHPLVEEQK